MRYPRLQASGLSALGLFFALKGKGSPAGLPSGGMKLLQASGLPASAWFFKQFFPVSWPKLRFSCPAQAGH